MKAEIVIPQHAAECIWTHNSHKSSYETVEQSFDGRFDFYRPTDFVSPAEFERAKATNELWTVQWYPNSPVGFNVAHASTLGALNAYLSELEAPAAAKVDGIESTAVSGPSWGQAVIPTTRRT